MLSGSMTGLGLTVPDGVCQRRMCFDKGDGEEKPAVFPSIVLVIDNAFLGMQSANISRVDTNGERLI